MNKIVLGIALALLPTVGSACSSVGRIPTNIELAASADLIVLARVGSGGTYGSTPNSIVVLQTVRALKGVAPRNLTVMGAVRNRDGKPFPLTVTGLDNPNPSALWGACKRQAYHPGGLVVAMFRKTSQGYVEAGGPFARSIEDVGGPDDLWVRASQLYARVISENKPAGRRKAFVAARNRLLLRKGDDDAQAIAADITRYLQATAKK